MITLELHMDDIDLEALEREIRVDIVGGAMARDAEAAPRHIARRIKAGRRADGGALPRPSVATVKRKGHAVPGVDHRVLTNPNEWPSARATRGGFEVLPPPSRTRAVEQLEQLGYQVMALDDEMIDEAQDELTADVDGANLQRFVVEDR